MFEYRIRKNINIKVFFIWNWLELQASVLPWVSRITAQQNIPKPQIYVQLTFFLEDALSSQLLKIQMIKQNRLLAFIYKSDIWSDNNTRQRAKIRTLPKSEASNFPANVINHNWITCYVIEHRSMSTIASINLEKIVENSIGKRILV